MKYTEARQQIIIIACEQFSGNCRVKEIAFAMRGTLPKREVEKALQRMEGEGVLLPSGPKKARQVHPDWWPRSPDQPDQPEAAEPVQETIQAPVVIQTQQPEAALRRARLYTIHYADGFLTVDNGVVAAWIFPHDARMVAHRLRIPDYEITEHDWWYFRDHGIACTLQPEFGQSALYIIQKINEGDEECETLIITTDGGNQYLPAFISPEAAECAARLVGLNSYRIEPQPFIAVMHAAKENQLGYRIMEVAHA
jgi:hypothetical protein